MLKCLFYMWVLGYLHVLGPLEQNYLTIFICLSNMVQYSIPGKLPIYPSPNPTFCPEWEVNVNVGLGRGGWRVSKNPILVFVVYESFCKTLVSLYVANKCSCETCLYTRLVTWELSGNQSWRLVPSPCRPESTSFPGLWLRKWDDGSLGASLVQYVLRLISTDAFLATHVNTRKF